MMTDMIVLCATLALSLFFWILSLTISTYYGELLSGKLSRGIFVSRSVNTVVFNFRFLVYDCIQMKPDVFLQNPAQFGLCFHQLMTQPLVTCNFISDTVDLSALKTAQRAEMRLNMTFNRMMFSRVTSCTKQTSSVSTSHFK